MLISATTAAGAPGATTSLLGLAHAWHRSVLIVEADPSGSSIAPGFLRGGTDHSHGLLNLALDEAVDTDLAEAVMDQALRLDDTGNVLLLMGLADPAQAAALITMWPAISQALLRLDRAGIDVLVDAGRATQGGFPLPLVTDADLALLVCRGTLSSVVRTAPTARALAQTLEREGNPGALHLMVIGETDYSSREISRELAVPLGATIPWQPKAAEALSDGRGPARKTARTDLAAGYRQAAATLAQTAQRRRAMIRPTTQEETNA